MDLEIGSLGERSATMTIERRVFWRSEELVSWQLPQVGAPSESRKFTTRFGVDDRGTLTASRAGARTSTNTHLLLRIIYIDHIHMFSWPLFHCTLAFNPVISSSIVCPQRRASLTPHQHYLGNHQWTTTMNIMFRHGLSAMLTCPRPIIFRLSAAPHTF